MTKKPASFWLYQLNGRLRWLKGNHDSDTEMDEALEQGVVEWIGQVRYVRHRRRKFWLSHYPHYYWEGSGRTENPTYHLFGHCHDDLKVDPGSGRLMDVGVDAVAKRLAPHPVSQLDPADYRPINFEEVIEVLERESPRSHHEGRIA